MSSFLRYSTLKASSEGRKLNLDGPDGKTTSDWILVRGQDAPEYKEAERLMRREVIGYIETNGRESSKSRDYQIFSEGCLKRVQASLVIGWSFDEPCTPENVITLFTEAPYVADQVDAFAGKRSGFAGNWPKPSEPLQSVSLSSPSQSQPTVADPVSEPILNKSPEASEPATTS